MSNDNIILFKLLMIFLLLSDRTGLCLLNDPIISLSLPHVTACNVIS